MKLILSRKGFDSSSGRVPSPIFPDDTMISLPIPVRESTLAYTDIAGNSHASVGKLVEDLADIPHGYLAHLDPDLSAGSIPRMSGWRPIFGQVGAAESHLEKQGVGSGDVFLFFGWFRHVEKFSGRWRYVPKSRPMHVIFGWLQIEKRVAVSDWPSDEKWAMYHPHFQQRFVQKFASNVVYVATEQLLLPGMQSPRIPGAGKFSGISTQLLLTKPDCDQRGIWLLPSWFSPKNRNSSLTYHGRSDLWREVAGGVELSTVGRGQEFVLDCDHYPEAIRWIGSLFDPTVPASRDSIVE
jgi:Nucleotide modification associated domain 3